jgi:hypothetical protein
MGVMTVETSSLHGVVLEFYFFYGIAHLLMAAETEVVPCFQQIELVLRCMRVMTFYTISLCHDLMGTACLFGCHIGVAGEADFIGIR